MPQIHGGVADRDFVMQTWMKPQEARPNTGRHGGAKPCHTDAEAQMHTRMQVDARTNELNAADAGGYGKPKPCPTD